jgi:hypothetical protein
MIVSFEKGRIYEVLRGDTRCYIVRTTYFKDTIPITGCSVGLNIAKTWYRGAQSRCDVGSEEARGGGSASMGELGRVVKGPLIDNFLGGQF